MLLRCCLIDISIIILRHALYLPYFYPCLDLGLFMSYLCSFFHFHLHFNLMKTHLFFCLFFSTMSYYFWMITWKKNMNTFKQQKFSLRVLLRFAWFFANFNLALLIKVRLYKKACILKNTVPKPIKELMKWSFSSRAEFARLFSEWVSIFKNWYAENFSTVCSN